MRLKVLKNIFELMKEDTKAMGPGEHLVMPGPVIEFIIETDSFEHLFGHFLTSDKEEVNHIYALGYKKTIQYFMHKLEVY